MPRLATPLTELLGIEHPVLVAPMAGITGGRLAAAVSAAGGLGLLGGGYSDPEWIDPAFRDAGNSRVGVGFITWALDEHPEALARALQHRPAAVMLSFGDPTPYVETIKQTGAKVICQVQRVDEAERAAALGADVIIAQGQEAGGHGRLGRGTLGLTQAIVEAVAPLPVAAAGGIADGRGLAAALALGAAGVLLGTRFYVSEEAIAAPGIKEALCAGRGDDTVWSGVFDKVRGPEWPTPYGGRSLRNAVTERWSGREAELVGAVLEAEQESYRKSDSKDFSTRVVWGGEAIDLIGEILPAGEIVRGMVEQAIARLADANRLVTA